MIRVLYTVQRCQTTNEFIFIRNHLLLKVRDFPGHSVDHTKRCCDIEVSLRFFVRTTVALVSSRRRSKPCKLSL